MRPHLLQFDNTDLSKTACLSKWHQRQGLGKWRRAGVEYSNKSIGSEVRKHVLTSTMSFTICESLGTWPSIPESHSLICLRHSRLHDSHLAGLSVTCTNSARWMDWVMSGVGGPTSHLVFGTHVLNQTSSKASHCGGSATHMPGE